VEKRSSQMARDNEEKGERKCRRNKGIKITDLTLDSVKCHTHCRSNNNGKRTRMGLATQATMQRMSSGNAKTSEISF